VLLPAAEFMFSCLFVIYILTTINYIEHMNIPLLNRFREMFSAPKQSRYDDDALASYMFSFLKEGDTYDNLLLNLSVRDLIEECQTYIFRDRPIQINAVIEAELKEDYDQCDEIIAAIHEQDTTVLCNLVKIRKHIFP
jgi:hypothetical protein